MRCKPLFSRVCSFFLLLMLCVTPERYKTIFMHCLLNILLIRIEHFFEIC